MEYDKNKVEFNENSKNRLTLEVKLHVTLTEAIFVLDLGHATTRAVTR